MRKFWIGKALMMLVCAAGIFALFSFIVMNLWNSILAVVLHISVITFWQAAGILLLSKILFGFGGKPWGGRHDKGHLWKRQMMQKWDTMTPEERQKFKQEFRSRCGRGWQRDEATEPYTAKNE